MASISYTAGELDDGFTELFAVFGISQPFVVGSLRQTYGLSGDTQTGAVHQRHYVFNQTELAVAAKFALRILVDQFASGRTVDTQFVFDAAHVYTAVTLVVDEHGQTAAVLCSLF